MTDNGIIQDQIELPDITDSITKMFDKRSKRQYPVRSLWASQIGHPCERFLIYHQTRWRKKKRHDAKTEMIFDVGKLHGTAIIRDLQDALLADPRYKHVTVEATELPLPSNPHGISGRLDAALRINRESERPIFVPIEIKTMSPHVFDKITNVQDMLDDPSTYMRQYPSQLMIYMYLSDCEWGLFVCRNKSTGGYKHFPLHLDLEVCEGLIQKADRVKKAVMKIEVAQQKNKNVDIEQYLPERVFWTSSTCGRCPFMSMCCPDMSAVPGIEAMLGQAELEEALDTHVRTRDAAKEFGKAGEQIKEHLKVVTEGMAKGQSKTIVTEGHEIEVKIIQSTKYPVPEEIKKPYAERFTYPKISSIK